MEQNSEYMKAVPVGEAEIEYSERGEGEPLLLVHAGAFADWFVPVAQSDALHGLRVIRVRRAGYGPNAPERPLTIQDHANHLWTLAQALQLETVHVAGHSSGALIAMQLASDDPELVRSLILLEPAPCGPLQVPAFAELGERFVGPAMAAFAAGDVEAAFDGFMRGVCGDSHREVIKRSLGKPGYEQAVRESRFFFQDEAPAAMRWKFGATEAGRIRQPVLIVKGAEGREHGLLSQQVTQATRTLLPHSEFLLLEGVSHLMPLENPDAVGRVIADFVRQHSISGALRT